MTKTAATLVTGGSNGIGAAIAASRAASGEVVINLDRNAPADGASGRWISVDLSDESALAGALKDALGGHDILKVVNCAGAALLDPIEDMTSADFRRTMDLNVLAPALIVQACLPAMKKHGFGRILNIASRAALGKTLRTAYAGSKGALISATRVWALELAQYGITVNAIGPGPIETELFRHANPEDSPVTKSMRDGIPVRRFGQPEDVAHAADMFLDDASGFVTGQVLYVCGGLTVGVAPV
ncbi:MAG: SDR family oxidoreductase [Pseudomonadota bacterium]